MKVVKEHQSQQSRIIQCIQKVHCNNRFRSTIQLYTVVKNGFPDYQYIVDRNDLKASGKEPNETTRDYVNGLGYNGGCVDLTYETSSTPIKTFSHSAQRINVPNPHVQINGRRLWDAGHALAKTLGGDGTNKNDVFPQSPPINQGNRNSLYQDSSGLKNYKLWREHEEAFKQNVGSDGHGIWSVYVH